MSHGDAFAYDGPAAIFREHAALSTAGNAGSRDFDIGGCADLGDTAYAELDPFQWPLRPGGEPAQRPFFPNGRFHSEDARARSRPTQVAPAAKQPGNALDPITHTAQVHHQGTNPHG